MKAIKFNLTYGNEKIKNLAELKNNCNVDMLLETLKNGMLVRWLESQGETILSETVSAINSTDNRSALSELFRILFDSEPSITEQSVAEIFTLREKEAARLEQFKNLSDNEKEIIEQYHKGYDNLIESIKESKDDYPKLKAYMVVLYEKYRNLLLIDKIRFYNIFREDYTLVLLSFMANRQLRDFIEYDSSKIYQSILPEQSIVEKKWEEIFDAVGNSGKKSPVSVEILDSDYKLAKFKKENWGRLLYPFSSNIKYSKKAIKAQDFTITDYYCPKQIEEQIKYEKALISLTHHIKIFSGKTDKYWKDIEPQGKTFMIISMEKGNKLRNAGVSGEELKSEDINGKFIFTNGIDYMSNSDTDKLIYMEI